MDGTNDIVAVDRALNSHRWFTEGNAHSKDNIAHAVYVLLSTDYDSYAAFASTEYNKQLDATQAVNLEYIHNNIHVSFGGNMLP
jgi:hypothetical protein